MMSGLLVPTQGKIKWIHQEQVLSEQEWFHYLKYWLYADDCECWHHYRTS